MNLPGLIFVLAMHVLAGRGLLAMFGIKERLITTFALSMITGVVIDALIPVLLEMCRIPITATSVGLALTLTAAALFVPHARKLDYSRLRNTRIQMPRLYELIFIVVFVALMVPTVWRCFYYPPNARDVISGPEPIADHTIKEHTMLNSAFTVDLSTTNNHLKPPFVSGLQIIYKLFVTPFGQLWISVIALCFLAWLYVLMRERLHPILAGLLMLLFITMPDPYAYTYIILFDYSNMVLFFAGMYYLCKHIETRDNKLFLFATVLFALATSIRAETLILLVMIAPLPFYHFVKRKAGLKQTVWYMGLFMFIPFVLYYLWMGLFMKYYMPVPYSVGQDVNLSPERMPFFFERFWYMNKNLLYSKLGLDLFGYMYYVFPIVLLADALFIRRFNTEARVMLFGILILYIGIPILGTILPLFDLNNTTKRSLYKMLPLMMLYMANSGVLRKLSAVISKFEDGDKLVVAAIPDIEKQ
jgi:hypothetical protein